MKKDIEETMEIPADVELIVDRDEVTVKAKGKELKRRFSLTPKIKIVKDNSHVKVSAKKATKKDSKILGTTFAHIKNMIIGIKEKFQYKLEVANAHFPMNVKVEGDKARVKSYFGEKQDRFIKILPNVEVKVNGNIIEISSSDIEAAGQTAANFEK